MYIRDNFLVAPHHAETCTPKKVHLEGLRELLLGLRLSALLRGDPRSAVGRLMVDDDDCRFDVNIS